MGEASYILGIKLLRDRKNKTLALSQAVYIDKIFVDLAWKIQRLVYCHSNMELHSLRTNHLKTSEEIDRMRRVPYAEAVGNFMYTMLCTRPDICFAVWMVSKYQILDLNTGLQSSI